MSTDPAPKPQPKRSFQAPKGTRDFYPQDLLRRRYITDAWRRVSLRHGFDEIDGPTFEHAELYTVKSGEGILSELFSFKREGGDDLYALRPEFTPTLARLYAARARQLPQPTKWFCIPNFFRAERPQRGRLREFFQWNADFIGGENAPDGDTEIVACALMALSFLGLRPSEVWCAFYHREVWNRHLDMLRVAPDAKPEALVLIDRFSKVSEAEFDAAAAKLSPLPNSGRLFRALIEVSANPNAAQAAQRELEELGKRETIEAAKLAAQEVAIALSESKAELNATGEVIRSAGLLEWCRLSSSIVRGLAYYTGMVFEVIAEGERAVAGGGRYDNLIELFGGPPTPACGFGMGDVVLGNLLDDRQLIPSGRDMLAALSRPMPMRPAAFVIANESEAAQSQLIPTVARLRRGAETEKYAQGETKPWSPERYSTPPMHARRSYKSTKNIGKLLQDAAACHARFAVIIESAETCSLKDLDSGEQLKDVKLDSVAAEISRRAPDLVG